MRSLRPLIITLAILGSFVAPPAAQSAGDIPVTLSGVSIPKDVTINRIWARVSSYGYSEICFSTQYSGREDGMLITDVSVVAPTTPEIKINPARNFIYFNQPESCAVFNEGDIWGGIQELTINAKIRKAMWTFYSPQSFDPVVRNLEALGIKVQEIYLAFSAHRDGTTFSVNVVIETIASDGSSLIGKVLRVRNAAISSNERSPVALNRSEPFIVIGERGGFVLGSTKEEVDVDLTGNVVGATFEWAPPVSAISKVKTSLPVTFELEAADSSYDASTDTSFVNFQVLSRSSKDLFLDLGQLRLASSNSTKKFIPLSPESREPGGKVYVALAKMSAGSLPTRGYLTFKIDGHYRDGGAFTLSGSPKALKATTIDFSKVEAPQGFTLVENFGSNLYFDPAKKVTEVFAVFVGKGDESQAMQLKGSKIPRARLNQEYSMISAPFKESDGLISYSLYFGTIRGDVRVGKKISVRGSLVLHPRTKVTTSLTSETEEKGIFLLAANMTAAEIWTYDRKKKMTGPKFIFAVDSGSKATIYGCGLKAEMDGKSYSLSDQSFEITGEENYHTISVPFIPGDVRFGAKPIELSGRFQLTPCS